MSVLAWNRANPRTRKESRSTVEALQTDVMRFMAILGFCLLAIFALVQRIPLTSAPVEATAPSPAVDDPQPTVAALSETIRGLRDRVSSLKSEAARTRQLRDEALKQRTALEEDNADLSAAVRRADDQYRQHLRSLAEVRGAIADEEQHLQALFRRLR